MDISYLKEFVVLADTLNFWTAAERLYIGESSLSKHIKALEKQLGAPLFTRTSRKVALTEFGQLMLPYAQSMAKLQYEYESAAFRYFHHEMQSLSISTIPVIAQYNITEAFVKFQMDHPTVRLDICETDTQVIRKQLLARECDIGIYRDSSVYLEHNPDEESQIVKIPYCTDELVAVLPPDHPLAGEKKIDLVQLAAEQFSLIRQDTMPYDLCIRACREAGFHPKVVFSSHNLEAILDMVRKGGCVSILFSRHIAALRRDGPDGGFSVAVVPVVPVIRTTVYLGYLKRAQLSPAAIHFIEYFKLIHPD